MPQSSSTSGPVLSPLSLGVCSWSLQVKSIAELKRLLDDLGSTWRRSPAATRTTQAGTRATPCPRHAGARASP